ncbi:Ryncolin-3 [Holothuria leucospilota]|uniref:Ryncolin-3 n=1 Tax=Holothuria leucospilota TaxID=206669 RepID=A0A9Q1H592_HOLLE|nr:Ryncolin-3 [Holothuria leucospilota]
MINFETKRGDSLFVTYNFFRIGDNFYNYTLVSVGDFTGTIESFVTWCPANMDYGNCKCQGTCANPTPTGNCNCSLDDRVCFCPDDFLMDGDKCILRERCGCYIEDVGVIPEGEIYVNSNCSQRCDCQGGTVTCTAYQCHSDATCKNESGVSECVCNHGYQGDGQSCTRLPIDCFDLQKAGNTASRDYTIKPVGWSEGPFTINCNMTIDGGGWTVVQRRNNGDQPFNLGWERYKEGFGTLTGEFWMGNDKLAFMTNQRDYELRIDFNNYRYQPYYAKYDLFRITDESNKYRLVGLGNYTGNAGYDSLRFHYYQAFSTIDEDNDVDLDNADGCAALYQSAWWQVKMRNQPATKVILRLENGFVNFHRDWIEYVNGFGFLNVDFWLGNEKLAYLTNQNQYELMINFETKRGDSLFVTYNFFRIGDNFYNYTLVSVGDFTGTIESFVTWCPANMDYGNCKCQGTCANPTPTGNCNCSLDGRMCFCSDEFLMHEDKCIPRDSCGCYIEDFGVIPEGETYVNSNCSQRCECQAGILTCTTYQCHLDATCKEENEVRQCTCNHGYEGDGQSCTRLPIDCFDLQEDGYTTSGNYTINPVGWSEGPFTINCNMTIDGGGWTVFQRRNNGDQTFNLGWERYKKGFGTLTGEFWMGNDKLAFMTNQRDYELRIDFNNFRGLRYYAKYDLFRITNESNKYRLVGLGNYTGNAGSDSLRYHHFQAFSTIDQDNDVDLDNAGGCAVLYESAWWYNDCAHSDLNRRYTESRVEWSGVEWSGVEWSRVE